MLLYIGKVREAEQEMRQALAVHPEQFKVMTYLGKFLYYQGRLGEAEPILQRAVELGSNRGSVDPGFISAFLYASRGQRNKIDPAIFREKPQSVIDGDQAYWFGGVYALLGENHKPLSGFEEQLSWETTTIHGLLGTRTMTSFVAIQTMNGFLPTFEAAR